MSLGVGGEGADTRVWGRGASALGFCCLLLALGWLGAAQAVAAQSPERRYVVVLDDSADRPGEVAERHADRQGAEIERVFTRRVDGYAAMLTSTEAKAVARQPGVEAVGLDPVGELASQDLFNEHRRMFAAGEQCFARYDLQVNQEIDIDCADDTRVDVDIAVLDTPVVPESPDLNVVSTVDCFGNDPTPGDDDPSDHTGCDPGHGTYNNECLEIHGSLVSLFIAGIDNEFGTVGIAPGARIWSVGVADKELGNPGACPTSQPLYLSDVIAGVEWTTAHADEIEVANLSLQFETPTDEAGEALDTALEQAIDAAVDAGIVFVGPAGNLAEPLADYLPAKYERMITVTAVQDSDGVSGGNGIDVGTCRVPNDPTPDDEDDTNADDSNYGDYAGLVDPWAAGADIAAPGICTSTSSALTAGAAAVLASTSDPEDASDVAAIRHSLLSSGNDESKANGGWDDETGTTREPLLDVSDDEAFDPRLTSPFWAYTEDFGESCSEVSLEGNDVVGGCRVEDFEGSFSIYAYLPAPYYLGTYEATFDLVVDSAGEGYAVDPVVAATGPWLSRVACDETDYSPRPWPVNSFSPAPWAEEVKIDMILGLRPGGGSPGTDCTTQEMGMEADQIGWGWNTELSQVETAPNLVDGHFESDQTAWLEWN